MNDTPARAPTEPVAATDTAPKGLGVIKVAFRDRRTLAMLLLGFSAGLPITMVLGTLNAWLTDADVAISTIGILSWVGLFAAFKFLWSPLVGIRPPVIGKRLGRRRSWLIGCQVVVIGALFVIAFSNPEGSTLVPLAIAAALAAFASATQDIVIDTWRIEVAGPGAPLDLLSTIYQFGSRSAALVGGAGSLLLADASASPTP